MRSYSIMVWSRATLATMLAAMIDGHVPRVDEQILGLYLEPRHRTCGGEVASLDQAQPVDLGVVHGADGDGERPSPDHPVEALALVSGQQLRIVQAGDPCADREHHGASHDRPRERPHADLVHARHHRVAHGPGHALVAPQHRTRHTWRLQTQDIRHQSTLTRAHAPLPNPPPFGGRESLLLGFLLTVLFRFGLAFGCAGQLPALPDARLL